MVGSESPENDDFTDAVEVMKNTPVSATNVDASLEDAEALLTPTSGKSVWFRFRPEDGQRYTATVTASFDSVMAVYGGDRPSESELRNLFDYDWVELVRLGPPCCVRACAAPRLVPDLYRYGACRQSLCLCGGGGVCVWGRGF